MLQDSAKQMSDSVLLKATSEIIPGVGALKTWKFLICGSGEMAKVKVACHLAMMSPL